MCMVVHIKFIVECILMQACCAAAASLNESNVCTHSRSFLHSIKPVAMEMTQFKSHKSPDVAGSRDFFIALLHGVPTKWT